MALGVAAKLPVPQEKGRNSPKLQQEKPQIPCFGFKLMSDAENAPAPSPFPLSGMAFLQLFSFFIFPMQKKKEINFSFKKN